MTIIEWFDPAPPRSYEWFGEGLETILASSESSTSVLAAVIGPRGPRGADGTSVVELDPDPSNRLTRSDGGLFVPPVSEGDFLDLTILFENSLL